MATRLLETAVAECGASAFTQRRNRAVVFGPEEGPVGTTEAEFVVSCKGSRIWVVADTAADAVPERRRWRAGGPYLNVRSPRSRNLTGAQFSGCLKKTSASPQMGARPLKSIREIEDFVVPLHRQFVQNHVLVSR